MNNNQAYQKVLAHCHTLTNNTISCLKLKTTITADTIGNLIKTPHKQLESTLKRLEDVEAKMREHIILNNKDMENLIAGIFSQKMENYINWLEANQDDPDLMDEISELLVDYPHLANKFGGLDHE